MRRCVDRLVLVKVKTWVRRYDRNLCGCLSGYIVSDATARHLGDGSTQMQFDGHIHLCLRSELAPVTHLVSLQPPSNGHSSYECLATSFQSSASLGLGRWNCSTYLYHSGLFTYAS